MFCISPRRFWTYFSLSNRTLIFSTFWCLGMRVFFSRVFRTRLESMGRKSQACILYVNIKIESKLLYLFVCPILSRLWIEYQESLANHNNDSSGRVKPFWRQACLFALVHQEIIWPLKPYHVPKRIWPARLHSKPLVHIWNTVLERVKFWIYVSRNWNSRSSAFKRILN